MRQIEGWSVWVGHVGDAANPRELSRRSIRAVVELAVNEPPGVFAREMAVCRFPLIDGSGNPRWLVRAAVLAVADLARSRTSTLVFCGAGMSRSPSIAAAGLALAGGTSPGEMLARILTDAPGDVSPGLWADVLAAHAQLLTFPLGKDPAAPLGA